jgi:hypothetical protein
MPNNVYGPALAISTEMTRWLHIVYPRGRGSRR